VPTATLAPPPLLESHERSGCVAGAVLTARASEQDEITRIIQVREFSFSLTAHGRELGEIQETQLHAALTMHAGVVRAQLAYNCTGL